LIAVCYGSFVGPVAFSWVAPRVGFPLDARRRDVIKFPGGPTSVTPPS
jgi:hypothetical protein